MKKKKMKVLAPAMKSSIVDLFLPSNSKFLEYEDKTWLDLSMGFTLESYL